VLLSDEEIGQQVCGPGDFAAWRETLFSAKPPRYAKITLVELRRFRLTGAGASKDFIQQPILRTQLDRRFFDEVSNVE
jgi:hypothetical protein